MSLSEVRWKVRVYSNEPLFYVVAQMLCRESYRSIDERWRRRFLGSADCASSWRWGEKFDRRAVGLVDGRSDSAAFCGGEGATTGTSVSRNKECWDGPGCGDVRC